MENQYNELLKTSDVELERLCLCRLCSKNVKKSYLYGKRVMVMLREVESLSSQGEFDAVTDETPIGEGEELPIQHTIVGQETMLEMINNRFSKRGGGFDVVIWVVVSQNATVHKIQGSIGEKLGLLGKEWEEKSEMKRGQDIHNVLRKKKFVLFLDDIWEKVSLDVIGVRYPNRVNGCKVAFTTRSREVCGRMGVDDPIEVCCLHTDKAWDLFKKKVGENTLASHRDIPELARKVAGKCRGLPLALNVIGETMASKRSVQEWHRAIQVLTSYAAEFSGVEDKILPILKYSYDSLDGEMTKSCFLKMITRTFVKMHDVVREMAMWIPSDLGKNKERCIVQAGARIRELPKVKNWKDVRRISLMENDIQIISVSPDCPQLTTLLLQRNYLVEISDGFFQSMPKLLVLDLSLNRLSGFRMDMYNLVSLRYLNLSRTYIVNLPFGLYQLKMLTHLNLEKTRYLESLEGISELSSLRTLKLLDSKVRPDMSLMKELQLLQHIEYVSVGISSSTLVGETLFDDSRMGRCIQQVGIDEKEPVKVLVLPALDGLHDIFIHGESSLPMSMPQWKLYPQSPPESSDLQKIMGALKAKRDDVQRKVDREEFTGHRRRLAQVLLRVKSCLSNQQIDESEVNMHDLVREMAMWIATDLGKNKEKCIVQARARLREIPKVKNWKDVRRISLTRNDIAVISESPDCPQVTTLLLQYNKLVEELPFGIYSLKLLTHLNFEGTRFLKSLDGISGLSSLKTLKLRHSKVLLDMSLMKELQLLQHIEYITVSISPRTLVGEKLFYDPKMGRCIQKVSIYNERGGRRVSKSNSFASFGRSLLHLHRRLWNVGGDKDREDTMEQKPDKSMLLKPHNWRLEEIISKEKAASVLENNIIPFKKLEKLSLMTLPELKSIYWNALPFQCLRYLAIMNDCPKLRKLPLNSESVFDVEKFVIRCEDKEWSERVEWEDEATRLRFLPSSLDGLHDIFIQFCRMLEEIKIEKTPWNKSLTSPCFSNLTQVEILSCNGLKDLTWLLFAPKLTHLRVAGSVQLENIISKEKAESVLEDYIIPFHKLEVLVLDDLPELESIYWNALPFQRLRWLHILNGCPKLRKLPLNSKSVVNVEEFVISCPDEECLERVEWEDEATRLRFLPSCKED
ncbi:hypothetical protein F2Q70_00041759 [Brassica cretica]|uniref:NB-ARC domain-containing protein n=1 Tax=Brassica cretica TaxID=69181 RepID=A0A8S9K4B5_BRACR|nr:hypothetical protein F2Q70_00041759 [Brassica cretica]